jgi:A/G-specific adenine glycosylase
MALATADPPRLVDAATRPLASQPARGQSSVVSPADQAAADEDAAFASVLLAWYVRHRRRLPWRSLPGETPDPYRVWLSEVMLQQTTVAAVIPYFEAFTRRWPTVLALAAAPDAEVMAAWAGLGYYSRARNLLAAARRVAEGGGVFPHEEAALRALPGVGAYTAAAIAAIAFGRRAVVVDGNVERVTARLDAVQTPIPAARPRLRAIADRLTPDRRTGDFAQAMMDLGATICTPRNPACGICPVRAGCAAAQRGDPARFPVKAARPARPERRGAAFVIVSDGEILLRRRPERGLLGGMDEVPNGDWREAAAAAGCDPLAEAPIAAAWRACGRIRHVFTHFALELEVFRADPPDRPAIAGRWAPIDALADAALPTLMRKAVAAALGAGCTRRG